MDSEALAARAKRPEWTHRLSPGNVGAAHELVVTVDLLRRGYTVFRNVGPHGPADLVALRNRKALLVEVTTCNVNNDGSLAYPRKDDDAHFFDVLALVTHAGEVTYVPALESL